MLKIILIVLAVIAAFYIAWTGGQAAYDNIIGTGVISPGDITISQVSNSKVDWVTLHNNLDRDADLGGFVFTDGDNIFTFPQGSIVAAGSDFRIASSKDEGEIEVKVDQFWGDWGLSEEGEMVTLINSAGDLVVDFVFAQPLENGQLLERNPVGTGPLMGPDKVQPMQMKTPSYRAVPNTVISKLENNFSTSVLELGGLLTGVASFVINMNEVRGFLGNFGGLIRKRKKR
jgi:hypothetical protein